MQQSETIYMWVEVSVLYKGLLARYDVQQQPDGCFIARLVGYKGEKAPPCEVIFRQEGRHCNGTVEETELMDDLCLAYQQKQRSRQY